MTRRLACKKNNIYILYDILRVHVLYVYYIRVHFIFDSFLRITACHVQLTVQVLF